MIKTFIYGTPHGFDFYEKDAAYAEYLKGFYISSRKGRRLMVNRKDNGETTYNYLRYGLREVIVRPNSFFGMTIVLEEDYYCPDFNKILEWFDYIFEKVLNEKKIFKKSEDGEIQYAVNKFDECASDVEWIKNNLPKILSQTAGTNILQYDNTFVCGRAGQIPCLNDNQTDKYYLSVFKKNYWITLSSEFPKQDEIMPTTKDGSIIVGGSPIELSYPDLKNQLDDLNKLLVPIATGVTQGSLDELTKMYDNAKYSYDSLSQYVSFIKGSEEADMFENLYADYKSLVNSISAMLSKTGKDDTSNTPLIPGIETTNIQYCYNCKQHKDASHFRSPSSMKCLECESTEQSGNRNIKIQCRKCGKYKQLGEFENGGSICRSCQELELNQRKICIRCGKEKSLNDFPLNSGMCKECTNGIDWRKYFRASIIPFFYAIVIFAAIVGLYWIINCSDVWKREKLPAEADVEVDEGIDTNKVSASALNEFLAKEQFEDAYKYIVGKTDKDKYLSIIVKAIDTKLWKIVDESNSSDAEIIKAELDVKITPLSSLMNQLGMEDEYILTLYQGSKDYARLQTILTKLKISEAEYEEGCLILERIGSKLPSKWEEALSSKWNATQSSAANGEIGKKTNNVVIDKTATPGPVTLTYTKVDGTVETKKNVIGNVGYDAKPGTQVVVDYPNGSIYYEKQKIPIKNSKSIMLESSPIRKMTYEFRCDDVVITITINPVPTRPKRH